MNRIGKATTQRGLSTRSSNAARRRAAAIDVVTAPSRYSAVPDHGRLEDSDHVAAAFVRQIGATRRVFLLRPHLSSTEMNHLHHRITSLTHNEGINSVLLASDQRDDEHAIPSLMAERDTPYEFDEMYHPTLPPQPCYAFHVAGGYDGNAMFVNGTYKDVEQVTEYLSELSLLALAMRGKTSTGRSTIAAHPQQVYGSTSHSKVPSIVIPHGLITNGGAWLLHGSYVVATPETALRLTHGWHGASLDPVGLSYVLPRIGQEFAQPSAEYAMSCARLLALFGYEANSVDLVETGLATHYVDNIKSLGLLEHTLSELPPWNQQGMVKRAKRYYGDPPMSHDPNADFRNVAVADAIQCWTTHSANAGHEVYTSQHWQEWGDPSLDMDPDPTPTADRDSELVILAAALNSVLTQSSLLGVYEGLKEVAAQEKSPHDDDSIDLRSLAKQLCERLDEQSPLALAATFRLLQLGERASESMESCMIRERRLQTKLLSGNDFAAWGEHCRQVQCVGHQDADKLVWKHQSMADVMDDEVAQLLEE